MVVGTKHSIFNHLWCYIKKNKLQDPSHPDFVNLDPPLATVRENLLDLILKPFFSHGLIIFLRSSILRASGYRRLPSVYRLCCTHRIRLLFIISLRQLVTPLESGVIFSLGLVRNIGFLLTVSTTVKVAKQRVMMLMLMWMIPLDRIWSISSKESRRRKRSRLWITR